MGQLYIDWVVDLYRAAGLDAVGIAGFQTRARSSGGFVGRVEAIFQHHTAGGYDPNHDWASANYGTFGATDKPIANEYIARSGRIWVAAAGATNTEGKGGPLGTLPKDAANARSWAKEWCNRGTGEAYSQVQQDAGMESTAVLAADFIRRGYFSEGELAQWRNSTHYIWAPTRKIDCFGPSRWSDGGKWDMTRFNSELLARVRQILHGTAKPPDPSIPNVNLPPDPNLRPPEEWVAFGEGARGEHVVRWQFSLTVLQGPIPGGCDGIFGSETARFTQWWQGTHGLPQTRMADIPTARSLGYNAVPPAPPPPPVVVKPPPPPPAPVDQKQAEKDRRSARISAVGLYRLKPHSKWGAELPYNAAVAVYGVGNRAGELQGINNPWPSTAGSRVWVPNTSGVLLVAMPGDSPWSMCELIYGSNINAHMEKFIAWNNGAGIVAGETYFLPTI